MASAAAHAAEVVTTGASGVAHWRFGNIDLALLRRLALPGMIGGTLGAYVLSAVPGETIAPLVGRLAADAGGFVVSGVRNLTDEAFLLGRISWEAAARGEHRGRCSRPRRRGILIHAAQSRHSVRQHHVAVPDGCANPLARTSWRGEVSKS
jgi:uncharacterized membrane protein YfcA